MFQIKGRILGFNWIVRVYEAQNDYIKGDTQVTRDFQTLEGV